MKMRGMILGMKEAGLSAAEITRRLGVNQKTVDLWLKRNEEEGNIKNHPKPGRPKKTSPQQDADIERKALEDPLKDAVRIRD